ncbi:MULTISPECIES: hypothetical protein [unclassified Streptomyces]|uniref:hypothetical protein n=1 Tax=unclassified Streptomyces TaxID=2593676 RepID=UPI003325546E
MTDRPKAHVQVTRFEVSVLPQGDVNRRHFTLYVEWRGGGQWAVSNGFHECLSADGTWSYESIPTERRDEWITANRFSLSTAVALAKEHAPLITVNGHTALDALERTL